MVDQAVFEEIRAEWNNEALPAINAGLPDRTDLMQPLWRADVTTLDDYAIGDRRNRVILTAVMEIYGVSRGELLSRTREKVALEARHMAYYVMSLHGSRTPSTIACLMRRDHSTINHGFNKIDRHIRRDDILRMRYRRVCKMVGIVES